MNKSALKKIGGFLDIIHQVFFNPLCFWNTLLLH